MVCSCLTLTLTLTIFDGILSPRETIYGAKKVRGTTLGGDYFSYDSSIKNNTIMISRGSNWDYYTKPTFIGHLIKRQLFIKTNIIHYVLVLCKCINIGTNMSLVLDYAVICTNAKCVSGIHFDN